MAIKIIVPMTTLLTENEQIGVAPKTVTATGNSRSYPELGSFAKAIFLLDVSAASGTTPTLDVKVQGWNPMSEKWHDAVTFTQQTTTTSTVIAPQSANLDFETYRALWTVGGTSPSFTFTLCAIAHTEEPITRTW
jgi:hypothetical protein